MQLLRESNNQNAFNVLYNLYLTINTSNAQQLIAFWQTFASFKNSVQNQDIRRRTGDFQHALIQRMKELVAQHDSKTLIRTMGAPNPLTFRERFENVVGAPLEQWKHQ